MAGPCDAGNRATTCGNQRNTHAGIDHGINPIYGANYDVKNYKISKGEFLACAVQTD